MKKALALIACSATLLLAGCGGQDTPTPPPDTAEGLWSGSITIGAANYPFDALVTPGGSLWALYTSADGSDGLVGAIQGSGDSDAASHSYASTDVTERLRSTPGSVNTGSIEGGFYIAQSRLSGTFELNNGARVLPFSSIYNGLYNGGLQLSFGDGNAGVEVSGEVLTASGRDSMTILAKPDPLDPDHVLSGRIGAAGDPNACYYKGAVIPQGARFYLGVTLTFLSSPGCSNRGLTSDQNGVFFLHGYNTGTGFGREVIITEGLGLVFMQDRPS